MPAMWAAVAGAGLDFAGQMMAKNEGVSRRTVRRRGRTALAGARSQEGLFAGLEEAALKKAHASEIGGFRGARKALDLGATQARQTVLGRGKQAVADTEQSIVSRGLLGTSTGLQSMMGVQDRTTAQLGAIDFQLAQAFADLGLEEGELLGRQGRELTGMAAKRRASEREFSEADFALGTLG